MKNIAIIAFNYAPYNVTGTFRILRFVKYLPRFGYHPIVFTSDQGNHHINNDLLKSVPEEADIFRIKTLFPGSEELSKGSAVLYKQKNILKRIATFFVRVVKDIFFSPDVQILWSYRAFPIIVKEIRKRKIKYLLATGSPFSSLWLASFVKMFTGVKVISDFRDPWVDYKINFQQTFVRTQLNKLMEKFVIKNSDLVISVTEPLTTKLSQLSKNTRFCTIPNNFDKEDYCSYSVSKDPLDQFVFMYAGKLQIGHDAYDPSLFLEGFKLFLKNNIRSCKLIIIGYLDDITRDFIDSLDIHEIEYTGFLNRNELLNRLSAASAFVQFTYPEKLDYAISIKTFEYAQYKKPIISFSSKQGCLADLLEKSSLGVAFANDDIDEIAKGFEWAYNIKIDDFRREIDDTVLDYYNVETQTKRLISLMETL